MRLIQQLLSRHVMRVLIVVGVLSLGAWLTQGAAEVRSVSPGPLVKSSLGSTAKPNPHPESSQVDEVVTSILFDWEIPEWNRTGTSGYNLVTDSEGTLLRGEIIDSTGAILYSVNADSAATLFPGGLTPLGVESAQGLLFSHTFVTFEGDSVTFKGVLR